MRASTVSAPRLRGRIQAPSDKSISHRIAFLNALADEPAEIDNYLVGVDTLDTLRALRELGCDVRRRGDHVTIRGRGIRGFTEAGDVLRVGTSATSARFLSGLVAPDAITTFITGSPSLRSRPMDRVAKPLRAMGATIECRQTGRPPLAIRGGSLHGIAWEPEVASSEVNSTIILAALRASSPTTIRSSGPTRDHTQTMLRAMGADVTTSPDGTCITVQPLTKALAPLSYRVPGEIGVAVYWLAAGSVHPDAEITIEDVCVNPHRTGIVDALRLMGAQIEERNRGTNGLEPIADLFVRSAPLTGTTIPPELTSRMLDEIPGFVLAACLAEGTTVIQGAGDLRNKKTNRLENVATEFRRLGADISTTADGLIVHGGRALVGTECDAHGDHRLATSLIVSGLVASGRTTVHGAERIGSTSYPGVFGDVSTVAGQHVIES